MSHAYDIAEAGLELAALDRAPAGHPWLAVIDRAMRVLNRLIMVPCMVAVFAAACILSYSVAARYFFKIPTDWQDEMAIFLLIGATFFSGASVQAQRGHVGVEAIAGLLSKRANRLRMLFVEGVSFSFCAFFAWKSWSLFAEALHEGHSTTSTWGPSLWIPYALMASGMTLLAAQLLLEFVSRVADEGKYQ